MNPFAKDSKQWQDFELMCDLKWHCSKCELKSGQAKTWQVWRQEKGIQIDTDENGNFYKIIFCKICGEKTHHRKLKSLEILAGTKTRSGVSPKLAKKVKDFYGNEEAILLRKISPNQLEVDHKFPQVRWNSDEEKHNNEMSDTEIREKFILLSRENNLWKSRQCEKCVKTGCRGTFPGIKFWGNGVEKWDEKISPNDPRGCKGCFWFDPYQWRKDLNRKLEDNS